MPQGEQTGRFAVYLPRDVIGEVAAFAKERGYKSMAEYARALIVQDMSAAGRPLDAGIDTWGRHSESPPDENARPAKRTRKKKTE